MSDATQKLTELLEKKLDVDGDEKEVLEVFLKVLITKALKGDIKALNMILERLEGKATQPLEINGSTDGIDNASTIQEINDRLKQFIESGEDKSLSSSSPD